MSLAVELSTVERGSASDRVDTHQEHRQNRCAKIAISVAKVAVPTLVISGVLAGMIYWGVSSAETILERQASQFIDQAEGLLESKMGLISDLLNSTQESLLSALEGKVDQLTETLNITLNQQMATAMASFEAQTANLTAEIREAVAAGVADGIQQAIENTQNQTYSGF